MSNSWLDKYLTMKPEVSEIFDDLEDFMDWCKLSYQKFDPADMYKSEQWKRFEKYRYWRDNIAPKQRAEAARKEQSV